MPEKLKNYIVRWNTGFGNNYEEIQDVTLEDANEAASELWRDEAESDPDYEVVGEATDEMREELL